MGEVEEGEFGCDGLVITITNVGNVIYKRTSDGAIGNESMVLDLNIGLGEVRKFGLGAPSGEYEVVIDDGIYSVNHRDLLTGKAISISDLKDVGVVRGYSVIWLVLIVVLGGVGFVLFRRCFYGMDNYDWIFFTTTCCFTL